MARKIQGAPVEMESNTFEPVPQGTYLCDIYNVDVREFGPNTANRGRENYNIQLRIADGPFTNRRVFTTVGLFPTWASGSDNFQFFGLFAAIEGISANELRKRFNAEGGIEIPDPEDIMGYQVTARVGIEENTYQGETTKRNTVRGFSPAQAGGGKAGPLVTDTVTELDI